MDLLIEAIEKLSEKRKSDSQEHPAALHKKKKKKSKEKREEKQIKLHLSDADIRKESADASKENYPPQLNNQVLKETEKKKIKDKKKERKERKEKKKKKKRDQEVINENESNAIENAKEPEMERKKKRRKEKKKSKESQNHSSVVYLQHVQSNDMQSQDCDADTESDTESPLIPKNLISPESKHPARDFDEFITFIPPENRDPSNFDYPPITNPLHKKILVKKEIEDLIAEGVYITKGALSLSEERLLINLCENFQKTHQISVSPYYFLQPRKLREVAPRFNNNSNTPMNSFMAYISRYFPTRTRRLLFQRLHTIYHPNANDRPWSDEDKQRLLQLVSQFGHDWNRIGDLMQRISHNCKAFFFKLKEKKETNGIDYKPSKRVWEPKDVKILLEIIIRTYFTPVSKSELAFVDVVGYQDLKIMAEGDIEVVSIGRVSKFFNEHPDISEKKTYLQITDQWNRRIKKMFMKYLYYCQNDIDVLPFNQVYDIFLDYCKSFRLFTKDDDLLLIDTIMKVKPVVQLVKDVHFFQLQKLEPRIVRLGETALPVRFNVLVKMYFLPDGPYAFHIGVENAPFVPLIDALAYLRRAIVENPNHEKASRNRRPQREKRNQDKEKVAEQQKKCLSEQFVVSSSDEEFS